MAGKQLRTQAISVTLAALIGILIYIAFRFEWTYGAAAVIALLHFFPRSASPAAGTAPLPAELSRLPPPERPALTVGSPKLLSPRETRARYAPVLLRVMNSTSPVGRTSRITCAAFAAVDSRIITPAFAYGCVFARLTTRATICPSPLSG